MMTKTEHFTEHQGKPTVGGNPADNAKPTEVLVKEIVSTKQVLPKK